MLYINILFVFILCEVVNYKHLLEHRRKISLLKNFNDNFSVYFITN